MPEYIRNKWARMGLAGRLAVIAVPIFIGVICLVAGPDKNGPGEFRIHGDRGKGHVELQFETQQGTNCYIQVWAADSVTGNWQVIDLDWGQAGRQKWVDSKTPQSAGQRFYRLRKCFLAAPEDADNDGIDDAFEMRHPRLDPLNPRDAAEDWDGDGQCNLEEYRIEKAKGFPKIVLDAVGDAPDPFSPALTSLVFSAQYRGQPEHAPDHACDLPYLGHGTDVDPEQSVQRRRMGAAGVLHRRL
jgi:hypothetical protein